MNNNRFAVLSYNIIYNIYYLSFEINNFVIKMSFIFYIIFCGKHKIMFKNYELKSIYSYTKYKFLLENI